MGKISDITWKEILSNQQFPLIGTNKPNEGNGYHDRISWGINYMFYRNRDSKHINNSFYNVYLRDLGNYINPNLTSRELFEKGFKIENCTDNYYNTFLKYFSKDKYYSGIKSLLRKLGDWGDYLSYHGRVIIEIVSWFDNKTNQFYGFELKQLDEAFCAETKNYIIYNAPTGINNQKKEFKKIKIPKDKCIVINFPSELGGYNGFKQKEKDILKLGDQFKIFKDPGESLAYMKSWNKNYNKNYNKILSDWGIHNRDNNTTEYYKELNAFRFNYSVLLCINAVINGLKKVTEFLNQRLIENAYVVFDIERFNVEDYKKIWGQWEKAELSFKEANNFLSIL